jgi:hypothetical protein
VVQMGMAQIYKRIECCGGMVSGLQVISGGVETEMKDSDSWMV